MIIDKLVFGILLPYPQTYTNLTTHPPATEKHFFFFFAGNVVLSAHVWHLICVLHIQDCGGWCFGGWFWLWRRNEVEGWMWLNRKKNSRERERERACGRAAGSSINRFICFFIALKWKWGYDGCQQNDDDGYWGVKELRRWSGQFGEVVRPDREGVVKLHTLTHTGNCCIILIFVLCWYIIISHRGKRASYTKFTKTAYGALNTWTAKTQWRKQMKK